MSLFDHCLDGQSGADIHSLIALMPLDVHPLSSGSRTFDDRNAVAGLGTDQWSLKIRELIVDHSVHPNHILWAEYSDLSIITIRAVSVWVSVQFGECCDNRCCLLRLQLGVVTLSEAVFFQSSAD